MSFFSSFWRRLPMFRAAPAHPAQVQTFDTALAQVEKSNQVLIRQTIRSNDQANSIRSLLDDTIKRVEWNRTQTGRDR